MVEQTIVRCAMGQKPVFTFSAQRHGQSTNGQETHHEDRARAEGGKCRRDFGLTQRARRTQRGEEIIFGIVVSHCFFLCVSAPLHEFFPPNISAGFSWRPLRPWREAVWLRGMTDSRAERRRKMEAPRLFATQSIKKSALHGMEKSRGAVQLEGSRPPLFHSIFSMPALLEHSPSTTGNRGESLLERMNRAIGALSATWMKTHEVWPKYTTDLGLEALLACFDATGDKRYLKHVERVWRYRHPPFDSLTAGNSYFTCIHFETYLRTGDAHYVNGLVELAEDWIRNAPRNRSGAMGHRSSPRGAIFLDLLGGLAPLFARAGMLSGEVRFHDECVRQIGLYRDALFDPVRGLWHHALDWHGSGNLSPAGWCRGSGWVLRGLEKSLLALPMDHPGRGNVRSLMFETLRGLLSRQDPGGLWHQLVHRPDSHLESSGSGFILAALGSPVLREASSGEVFFDPALRMRAGIAGLLEFVDRRGVVSNGCPECPPQASESDYLQMKFPPGDPHAGAAVLLAFAAALKARNEGWF